jgi:hypothetical protein
MTNYPTPDQSDRFQSSGEIDPRIQPSDEVSVADLRKECIEIATPFVFGEQLREEPLTLIDGSTQMVLSGNLNLHKRDVLVTREILVATVTDSQNNAVDFKEIKIDDKYFGTEAPYASLDSNPRTGFHFNVTKDIAIFAGATTRECVILYGQDTFNQRALEKLAQEFKITIPDSIKSMIDRKKGLTDAEIAEFTRFFLPICTKIINKDLEKADSGKIV